jgi:predicted CopG family antitoxin
MHGACMATKTISLRLDAYERLRRARQHPGESFTEVVLRAQWPDRGVTARELHAVYRSDGPFLDDEAVERVAEAKTLDRPPGDKWKER